MAWRFINLVFYAAFNKQAHKCSVSESFNYGVTGQENNIREPIYGRFSAQLFLFESSTICLEH